MKGDFTRQTFRSRNHYDRVLLQQGRVQLDADWNEQVDIDGHRDRTTTRDLVGFHGGPLAGAGMGITAADGSPPDGTAAADLRISAGRYYVDGVLCENEEPVPLAGQPDLPRVALPSAAGRYAGYLDVWREHVTALERPELREVALGGPDTATRSRTVWQLRLVQVAPKTTCADLAPPWTPPGTERTGRLRARAQAPEQAADPCVIPATAGYRRLENQLYRVEIHDGSDAARGPTYVWSRDNGAVVARLVGLEGDTITIDAPGRDERLGFAKDQWVEVIDTDRVRRGEPGFLARLDDAVGTELTVAQWRDGTAPDLDDLGEVAMVRRWDSAGAVAIAADWVDLEDGVQVQFEAGGAYGTGDYWLIPARTANLQGGADPDLAGDVEWPREGGGPRFEPRAGIEHRYAAVALLDLAGNGRWTLASDCRRLFPPLTDLTDVEYAGGDGQEAMPGDPLPQPLRVSLSNGTTPVPGARIRFVTADAGGRLALAAADLPGSATVVDAQTGPDGVAQCFWRPAPDPAMRSQRVTARLLDAGGDSLGAPIEFSANLSIADQVWLDASGCTALNGVRTVQDALDRLVAARSVVAIGGDGQAGAAGSVLPHPIEVLVRNDCGPVPGAVVRFAAGPGAAVAGSAGGAGVQQLDVPTDANGVARGFWTLGNDPVQRLTATLQGGDAPVEPPDLLAFMATVESAGGSKPGLHVTGAFVGPGARELRNDTVEQLGDGIQNGVAVVLDGVPDKLLVNGKPVLTLTLDLPFPLDSQQQELWGRVAIGTTPLALSGTVRVGQVKDQPAVIWEPAEAVPAFLERLFELLAEFSRPLEILCHLTLTGRAVAAEKDPELVVNGLATGRPRPDATTDLALPTVDDVRGADFTLWFWLVGAKRDVIILPFRDGLLRLKTLRDAIALSVPRDAVVARLPRDVRLEPGEPDREAARRAADRGFRDRPDRRLVLIVDRRIRGAGTVIRRALGELDVELEVIASADPAAAARHRIEAGEQLDGVLTTMDMAAGVAAVGGFGEAVPL